MHFDLSSSAFCVVCGRFDRQLILRKSGLKCAECVGKRSKKQFTQLQFQHAAFMLSREHNATLGGANSPRGLAQQSSPRGNSPPFGDAQVKRLSLDLTATASSTLTATMGSATYNPDRRTPRKPLNFSIDSLAVRVHDARTEEVDSAWTLLHSTESVTTYAFTVFDRNDESVLASTRHRFRDAYRVFAALKEIGGNQLPELPEKKILNRFDPQFVDERRCEMERFLNAALSSPFFVRHPQLLGLLGVEQLVREMQLRSHEAEPKSAMLPTEQLSQCKRGSLLGKGTFGSVFLGLLPSSSQLVAIKVINTEGANPADMENVQSELNLLRTLDHPNIVRFLGALYDGARSELSIFTEYVECGSIAGMVRRFGALPMPVIQKYLQQICEGLAYLHGLDVVHRDIKGDNILVTKDGSVKLADFGCSASLSSLKLSEGPAGTPQWMAPEVVKGETGGAASDIWSFGCMAIEMLQRPIWNVDPNDNAYTVMFKISRSDGCPHGMPEEDEIDHDFREFMLKCFSRDPAQRATARELLADPFFSIDYVADDPASPRASGNAPA